MPDEISSWGVDPKELTPAAALKLSIEFAIKQKLDAVLFAGDIVESTNARFEAMLPLEDLFALAGFCDICFWKRIGSSRIQFNVPEAARPADFWRLAV